MASAGGYGFGVSASTRDLLVLMAGGALLLMHAEGKIGEALNIPGQVAGKVLQVAGDAGQAAINAQNASFQSVFLPTNQAFYSQSALDAKLSNPTGNWLGQVAATQPLLSQAGYAFAPWLFQGATAIGNSIVGTQYVDILAPYSEAYRAKQLGAIL